MYEIRHPPQTVTLQATLTVYNWIKLITMPGKNMGNVGISFQRNFIWRDILLFWRKIFPILRNNCSFCTENIKIWFKKIHVGGNR